MSELVENLLSSPPPYPKILSPTLTVCSRISLMATMVSVSIWILSWLVMMTQRLRFLPKLKLKRTNRSLERLSMLSLLSDSPATPRRLRLHHLLVLGRFLPILYIRRLLSRNVSLAGRAIQGHLIRLQSRQMMLLLLLRGDFRPSMTKGRCPDLVSQEGDRDHRLHLWLQPLLSVTQKALQVLSILRPQRMMSRTPLARISTSGVLVTGTIHRKWIISTRMPLRL